MLLWLGLELVLVRWLRILGDKLVHCVYYRVETAERKMSRWGGGESDDDGSSGASEVRPLARRSASLGRLRSRETGAIAGEAEEQRCLGQYCPDFHDS